VPIVNARDFVVPWEAYRGCMQKMTFVRTLFLDWKKNDGDEKAEDDFAVFANIILKRRWPNDKSKFEQLGIKLVSTKAQEKHKNPKIQSEENPRKS
jgi:hypothetical protein